MFRILLGLAGWWLSRMFFRRRGYRYGYGSSMMRPPYGPGYPPYGQPPYGQQPYAPMQGFRGGGFMPGLLGGLGGAFLGNELFGHNRWDNDGNLWSGDGGDGGWNGGGGDWGGGDSSGGW